jgi:large subunit ribosomal protein L24
MSRTTYSKARLKTITVAPKHIRDKNICSTLSDDLREQYKRRSIRVIKGDTVQVMRGEYAGIEGKVEKVNTSRGTLSIEGVQREKVRGGNVKVQIHSSKVRVSGLNLDDKYRQDRVRRQDQMQDTEKDNTITTTVDDENNDKNSGNGKRNINISRSLRKRSLIKRESRKKKRRNSGNNYNNNKNSHVKNQSNEENGG